MKKQGLCGRMLHWLAPLPLTAALLIFAEAMALQAAEDAPAWISRRPADDRYYYGVGTAPAEQTGDRGQAEADRRAVQALLTEIRTTVTVEVTASYREEASETVEDSSFFERVSSFYSSAELQGLQISSRYYDKGRKTFYSLARLLKSDLEDSFRRREEDVLKQADERNELSDELFSRGYLHSALSRQRDLYLHILDLEAVTGRPLRREKPNDTADPNDGSDLINAVESALQEGAYIYSFEITEGSGQTAERGRGLENALRGRMSFLYDRRELPARQVPLILSLDGASGRFDRDTVYTDEDGRFEVRVSEILSVSASEPAVRIHYEPGFSDFPAEQRGRWKDVYTATDLLIPFSADTRENSTLFVHVFELEDGDFARRSDTQAEVLRLLIGNRYQVVDVRKLPNVAVAEMNDAVDYEEWNSLFSLLRGEADLALTGYLRVDPDQDTGAGLVFAVAEAKLTLLDIRNGKVKGEILIQEVEGDGYDARSAMRSAAERCRSQIMDRLGSDLNEVFR